MEKQEFKAAMITLNTTMKNLENITQTLAAEAEGLRGMLEELNNRLYTLAKTMASISSKPSGPFH